MSTRIETEEQDGAHRRRLLVDGEPVSRLWVLDRAIRLLGREVSAAGIGGVRTRPEHRNRGYARRLLRDTVGFMTDGGWQVSMLFGIPDFYHRFGFAPCIAVEQTTVLRTRAAERAGRQASDYRDRPVEEADRPFIVDTYNRTEADRPASVVRDAERFRRFERGTGWETEAVGRVLEDERGERIGYLACNDEEAEVNCVEAGAAVPAAYPALTDYLARLAVERRCGELRLHLPVDHPLAVHARRYGCLCRVRYQRTGGGMMRVLNQGELLGRLRPALEERLRRSRFRGAGVDLTLETDLDATTLALNPDGRGRLRLRVEMPQEALMQVAAGYRPAADAAKDPKVHCKPEAVELLEALFGEQPVAYVHWPERF
ncbi:MAG: GNAT family N-acetyltransferase [Planctomycetota bacterium]